MKNRIREFRARERISQRELAERVGVRRETIVFLEKGKYNPSLRLAHEIAKVLDTEIEELFIFEEHEKKERERRGKDVDLSELHRFV